jgi:histidinol dehydrogenase
MEKPIVFRYPQQSVELEIRLAPRRNLYDRGLIASVTEIFRRVEQSGDAAIGDTTQEHDGVLPEDLLVDESYVRESIDSLSPALRDSIAAATENIAAFNAAVKPETIWTKEIAPGGVVGEKTSPLDSVGLWIPSRKGPLISTALMLVTAAKVAGVRNIQVGMPPSQAGTPDAATVAAAHLAGATSFVCGNGVAIIAAWSIGTKSIAKANAVYGPGPGGIAAAMSVAFSYGVKTVLGIGPTDSLVMADDSADARCVARDLLNEAEHGKDSCSVLVTPSGAFAADVAGELTALAPTYPEKAEIVTHSFGPKGLSCLVVADGIDSALEFANDFAPEHMVVNVAPESESSVVERIQNCGELLIGPSTPFSAGNYAIGITAVLPTNGYARSISGITCKDMMKTTTIGRLTPNALAKLHPTIEAMGAHERLPWHVEASRYRRHGLPR